MSEPDLDRRDLVARVAHLERRQRVLQPLAGLAMVLTMGGLVAFASEGPDVVQAQRVELVDLKGDTQAALAADTTGVRLTLFDKRGRVTATLRLDDDPRLAVLDGGGREVAGLGAPRAQHLAQ
jgi:hypothetical protein